MSDFIRDTHIPLYIQVYNALRKEIKSGKYEKGERLPSEHDLAKKYSISRLTLRKSLVMLIDEGLIFTQQGVGNFVSNIQVQADYTKLTSFSAEVEAQGQQPGAIILSIFDVNYIQDVYKSLELSSEEKVTCVKRLRTANQKPVAIQYSYFPKKIFDELEIDKNDVNLSSIMRVMENNGFIYSKAVESISATVASINQSELLKISQGDALLYIERISYSNKIFPLEFVKMYVIPDRYKCRIFLQR